MCEVREACLWILVFTTPPGKNVAAKSCVVALPVRSTAPIIGFVLISAIGKDICYLPNSREGDEVEPSFD